MLSSDSVDFCPRREPVKGLPEVEIDAGKPPQRWP